MLVEYRFTATTVHDLSFERLSIYPISQIYS
jgi:hypothetical protein